MNFSLRFLMPVVGFTAFSAAALAASSDMLSVSGHARTRYEYIKHQNGGNANNGSTDANQFLNRVRLNLDVAPSSMLKVRLTPELVSTWGDYTTNNLTAHEAWMAYMPSDMLSLFIGRQVLSYGNEMVLGANDWAQTSNHHDAARARVSYGMGTTDLFWAKTATRTSEATRAFNPNNHDGDLYGLYNTWNVERSVPMMKTVDLYFFYNNDRDTGSPAVAVTGVDGLTLSARAAAKSRYLKVGTRLAGMVGAADYNLETNLDYGYTSANGHKALKGYTLNATVGTKLMDRHHVGLGFDYANSEAQNIAPSVHKFLGESDVFSRNNILAINLNANVALTNAIKARAAGFMFMRAKSDAGYKAGALAGGKGGTDRPAAWEGDFEISYAAAKNLGFDLGYDFVKFVGEYDNLQTMNKVYLQGTLTF